MQPQPGLKRADSRLFLAPKTGFLSQQISFLVNCAEYDRKKGFLYIFPTEHSSGTSPNLPNFDCCTEISSEKLYAMPDENFQGVSK